MVNYTYPKIKYTKNGINKLLIFFENGDFVEVRGAEIINFSVNTYDKLVRSYKGYNPVAQSGYIKLKICKKFAFKDTEHFVYNESEFLKDRKSYIQNRCINESRITQIWFFDTYSWHKVLHCEAKAKMDEEFLMIEFLPQPQMGTFESSNHTVNIANLDKKDIHHIDLDFENCESFVVYRDEIQEVNLVFENNLDWDAGDLERKVSGGFIKLKLNKDFTSRKNHLFDNDKKLKLSDLGKRLCGSKGECIHDICHLYIAYGHAGYGTSSEECIVVDDVKTDEEVKRLEKLEEETGEWCYYYEGGYCKKMPDKSIIIAFGTNARNTINKMCNP